MKSKRIIEILGLCFLIACALLWLNTDPDKRRAELEQQKTDRALNAARLNALRSQDNKPDEKPFETIESRERFARLVIAPALRGELKNPASLQDVRVINAALYRNELDTYKVEVMYRAANSFTALSNERMTFLVSRDVDTDGRWKAYPLYTAK